MKAYLIYGSENDKPFMEPALKYFQAEEVGYVEEVLSAHRDLDKLIEFLDRIEKSGAKGVILAIAGLAAALPGVVAMKTSLPVIGVPVPGGPLNGIEALLSISQLPGGVPATTALIRELREAPEWRGHLAGIEQARGLPIEAWDHLRLQLGDALGHVISGRRMPAEALEQAAEVE